MTQSRIGKTTPRNGKQRVSINLTEGLVKQLMANSGRTLGQSIRLHVLCRDDGLLIGCTFGAGVTPTFTLRNGFYQGVITERAEPRIRTYYSSAKLTGVAESWGDGNLDFFLPWPKDAAPASVRVGGPRKKPSTVEVEDVDDGVIAIVAIGKKTHTWVIPIEDLLELHDRYGKRS